MVFHASSQSLQLSESDDQFSFSCPTSALTPNKTESETCIWSVSSDSRHSMTPFKVELGGSFSIPSGVAMCCSSLTPVTSATGSQQVTSSRWHQPVPFSPLTLQGLDPLNTEQAAEVYQLATEFQALGSDLTKWFQSLCRLNATCTLWPRLLPRR